MDYQTFGYGWLDNDFISLACYNITRIIENEGFEAVPVFPNPPEVYGQEFRLKAMRCHRMLRPTLHMRQ